MFWQQWAHARGGHCGPRHNHQHSHGPRSGAGDPRGAGRGFGVRRPLRFLARQLELTNEQTERLAALLDALKTQRAQASVDHKKALGAFADVFAADEYDGAAVKAATEARAASVAEVERAVAKAIEQTYALLDAEQRKRLAYLLRTDGITI